MDAIKVEHMNVMNNGFYLKDINFTLPQGCVMGLVGRNGAGKTTLMKALLAGYQQVDGEVTFFHKKLAEDREELLHAIAFIGDEFAYSLRLRLFRLLKVYKNAYPDFQPDQFEQYCKEVNIDLHQSMIDLSLGQKKLVELYFALSRNAKLLVLDEPMANLDPIIRRKIIAHLHQFMLDETHSILISSHILSDLEKIADYIILIDQGELCLCEAMDALLEQYVIERVSKEAFDASMKLDCVRYIEEEDQVILLYDKRSMKQASSHLQAIDMETLLYYMSEGVKP